MSCSTSAHIICVGPNDVERRYDQEWGCADEEPDGGRCSPTTGKPFIMGKVFPTDDPEVSLFDYRVASHAIKKLAFGARAYTRQRRPFLLGVSLCGINDLAANLAKVI